MAHNGMEITFAPVIVNASQVKAGRKYLAVSKTLFIDEQHSRASWLIAHDARHHPYGRGYPATAAVRAVAHCHEHPGSVISGFSALAVYGLPFLVDAADTTLHAPVGKHRPASQHAPSVTRLRPPHTETWTLTHRGLHLRVATPERATVQALQLLRHNEHSWQVEEVEGLDPVDVRAIQLIDCVRRHLEVTPKGIRAAAFGQLNARWLSGILARSRDTADSPKETELRLLLEPIVDRYGLALVEQFPIVVGGRVITTLDFAIPLLKIGAMFDGHHHWEWEQRQKDSSINMTALAEGWKVPRTSAKTMRQCVETMEALIVDALREL